MVVVVYVVTLAALEPKGFWITDNASKFLQVEALIANGYRSAALPWPGHALDPDHAFTPLPSPFSHVRDGRLYSQYPPLFAFVSSFPYRWFGHVGLYLLPLLGAVLTLAAVARLAARLAPRRFGGAAAVLLAGLTTPLWFYSVVFWEHSLALALCTWGAVALLRGLDQQSPRWLAVACGLTAAAAGLREESVLMLAVTVVLGVAASAGRRFRSAAWMVITGGLVLAPVSLYNWLTSGSPLGPHTSANLVPLGAHLAQRPGVVYRLFFAAGPGVGTSLALTTPLLGVLLLRPCLSAGWRRCLPPALVIYAVGVTVLFVLGLVLANSPINQLLLSNSLLPVAPLLVLGALREEGIEERPSTVLWWLALGFAGLYALAAPGVSSQGIHWGCRFLLPVYPLLAALAAARLNHWLTAGRRRLVALALGAALAGLAAQAYGIHLLAEKKAFTERANRIVLAQPEPVVVARVWWGPQLLNQVFYAKQMFFAPTPADLAALRERMRRHGIRRFLLVEHAPGKGRGAKLVVDEALAYFSLAVTSLSP